MALAAAAAVAVPFLLYARLGPRSALALSPRRLLSCSTPAYEPRQSARPPLSKQPEPESQVPWRAAEAEILRDVGPVVQLIKDILHSDRYADGECLGPADETVVAQKLLAYHPRAEDKVGCGLDGIMVDRHPQFRKSRCLFVVRMDGVWIDFSYQKCLREYIRKKYPSHGERFIREHFKRT
ncbi:protein DCL, chloroplastic [Hordeum vulgare]|uniref:Predicted protein n=1 Tax=Hordeum vulgare subsp. vulgare TaxID=112509 RepID=F2D5G6_HORVV|nr:protein DCL homolog, chloroplastic-like [Hordeum vulgare subsp. vulgare]KAE8813934.1 protein DCL, chloroplastic [Hordeum vulgare]BAJ90337.1 predicted protein [Hordeum vulgare subsp. vulgare]